ncbi:MAG: enoyl-CoA hydratase/isomerase family protein [Acidobacteriota bacterium]
MKEVVTFEVDDGVGIIRLNRPEVHNAVNDAVMAGLEAILDRIEEMPEVRALILTGAGEQTFCAGGDLKYFASLESQAAGEAMSHRMQALLRRLADGPRPVIAAVNGNTLGGGCEILVACHLRLAVATARFSFRQAAMGIVTGWGGGARVFRLLGRAKALELLLTAKTIEAGEAQRLGLVDHIVDEGERLMDEALSLAQQIAANSRRSVAAFLELARVYEHDGASAAEQRERELFGEAWVGEQFRRQVEAWKARRQKG